MPISIDKVKPLRLLKTQFYTPFIKENKRHGSAIFLITPNLDSSIKVLNSKLMVNMRLFYSYYMNWQASYMVRDFTISNEEMGINESFSYPKPKDGHPMMTSDYCYIGDKLFFFAEATAENVMDTRLRKLLYNQRLKTVADLKPIYTKVKSSVDGKMIKYTYHTIDKYKNMNLFVDNSYYFKLFFDNNTFKRDMAIDIVYSLMDRFINSSLFSGYKRQTVIIPVDEWVKEMNVEDPFDFMTPTPISMIYRLFKLPKESLSKLFGIDFIFMTENAWFKLKLEELDKTTINRFKTCITSLVNNAYIDDTQHEDNEDVQVKVIDKIEQLANIEINSIEKATDTDIKGISTTVRDASEKPIASTEDIKDANTDTTKMISKAVSIELDNKKSLKTDEEIEDIINNDDTLKALVLKAREEQDDTYKISPTRRARLDQLNDKFLSQKIHDTPIRELVSKEDTPLDKTDLSSKVETIDDEWSNLQKPNFEKNYDIDADILKVFKSLSEDKDIPMSVIDITSEDRSTSEDYIITYTVHLEDSLGKRHTIRFDMPKIVGNRFLRLRGNDKIIPGQLVNLPIIKTDSDTVQVVSNYNKIFITRYGQVGKLNANVDTLLKGLNKFAEDPSKAKPDPILKKTDLAKVEFGNNAKICTKYDLPMEYVDIAHSINRLRFRDGKVLYFNMDEYNHILKDRNIKIPNDNLFYFGIKDNEPIGCHPNNIAIFIRSLCLSLADIFNSVDKNGRRLVYSQASILNGKMPLIVVMAYTEGLTKALDIAKVNYTLTETRPKSKHYIKFKDGFMDFFSVGTDFIVDSLLINGLFILPTEEYSITDINSKAMWLDMLEEFGTRNRADGLDSFANLMMDPLTVEVCKAYNLPYKYTEVLAYASSLLADNKFNKHTDITGNRFRTNERLVHFLYKCVATSYGEYLREVKNNRKDAKMTMKQSAVVDLAMGDVTTSDLSKLSPLLELESANTVTFKGLSGMNSDRSYSLDKRTYDKTMLNKLSLSTGFSATVGINRQATINMAIDSTKGYIKSGDELNKMTDASTLSITEALVPFGTTRDDPFRSAMTFIQTSKHGMRTKVQDPLLVTNGADQALPFLTTNTYAHKAKENSIVEVVTDDYMILFSESGAREFIDLRENVEKNSDGGFWITIKLDPVKKFKKGNKIKAGEIVAYDKSSYSDSVGKGNLAYNVGTLTKVAIMHTDEGFEDSAVISESLSQKMGSEVILMLDARLNAKDTDIKWLKPGTPIQEGQVIMSYRSEFEDSEATDVISKIIEKNSGDKSKDLMDELGKILIKSKVTGFVQDIKVYSTVEPSEMSPSLRKFVEENSSRVTALKNKINGFNTPKIEVLPPIGKLKGAEGKVLVELYIKYIDNMSIGDKLVYFSALKGVVKTIFPKGQEPYSEFRPNETVHSFLPVGSVNARMVSSVLVHGAINKVLIELDRKVKDIMGIKWDANL